MNPILKTLFFLSGRVACAGFARLARKPELVQQRFLSAFLKDFRNTSRGRDLQLHAVSNLEDFQSQIPASEFADYESYIDRIWDGEQGVLTPKPVIYLSMSGGSTGRRKLIPVTRTSHRHRNRARRVSTGFFARAIQRRNLELGSIVLTNCAVGAGESESGIPCGKTSAGDMTLNRFSYRGPNFFPYPFDAFDIEDSHARHYVCLLFAARDRDTRILTGNFPTLILHMANFLEAHHQQIIEDMQTGCINPDIKLPAGIRKKLEGCWQADKPRANELAAIVSATGHLKPVDVWPGLSAIVTARGQPSYFYFDKFKDMFGPVSVFGGIYGATESIYGIYHDFDSDQAVLAINTAFYEFVPRSDWDQPFPHTLRPTEVVTGEEYRILVTNYAGLCRFDIGDVVRVNGWYENTPTISFVRRKGGFISSVAEKTTDTHVQKAIQTAQQTLDVEIEDYCITLLPDQVPSAYVVNVEVRGKLNEPQRFLFEFDQALQGVHNSYRLRRADILPKPILRVLVPGSFQRLREQMANEPGADTNIKLRHTSEDRDYLGECLVESEYQFDTE